MKTFNTGGWFVVSSFFNISHLLLKALDNPDNPYFLSLHVILMASPGSPTVMTMDPQVNGNKGTFNGEAWGFFITDTLDVWYQYGQGSTLPSSPQQSPHSSVLAQFGPTPLPSFDLAGDCGVQYSYQVCTCLGG